MDKTAPWTSLKNVVLALAAVSGGLAGLAARYYVHAPYTAEWRRQQHAASVEQPEGGSLTIGLSRTAVQ